jgi:hypothetical protein
MQKPGDAKVRNVGAEPDFNPIKRVLPARMVVLSTDTLFIDLYQEIPGELITQEFIDSIQLANHITWHTRLRPLDDSPIRILTAELVLFFCRKWSGR